MVELEVLPGLPVYGPPAIPIPPDWGRLGREGTVVRFSGADGGWIGNFQRGFMVATFALPHPDGFHVIVVSRGALWIVDPVARSAEELNSAIEEAWPVREPDGYVFSRQGIAFLRIGARGVLWHTRRISWDGFESVQIEAGGITGNAWDAVNNRWTPFKVDLATGAADGGGHAPTDTEGWERLA